MEGDMELLTIGAFARASRLSPKALRLYDELGLLPPARVDPVNGYRLYAPAQLERARLVAWLRRIGMPLARIRDVCALEPPRAAEAVRGYWAQAEAEVAARRELVSFLIDHLTWKDTAMTTAHDTPMRLRYAALSDTGRVRESNQDTVYAGSRLLAVADGCGSGGSPASAAAVDALRRLETEPVAADALLGVLADAARQAGEAVRGIAAGAKDADRTGTTLTAMLWTGSHLGLVHIGDTRAHVLRDGELLQITQDHTMVQSLVDEGRLTVAEAASHPQRALLVRALSGAPGPAPQPDLRLHEVRAGDRYLLCSDGLSAVVPADDLRRTLTTAAEPDAAALALVAAANTAGGPDNVSCVVADVLPA
jgi:serine/threonine protein phosphatase PrpC